MAGSKDRVSERLRSVGATHSEFLTLSAKREQVCDYVDAYYAVLLPTAFYCFANSEENAFGPAACNANSLCEHRGGQCRQTRELTLKALKTADKQVNSAEYGREIQNVTT